MAQNKLNLSAVFSLLEALLFIACFVLVIAIGLMHRQVVERQRASCDKPVSSTPTTTSGSGYITYPISPGG